MAEGTAVVFEDRALLRQSWGFVAGGRRRVRLEPGAERVLRHLEEASIPYGVVTTLDADAMRADLAELCTFPDAVVTTDSATARRPWITAVDELGVRAENSVALISTDDANWAAGQAGLHPLYPSGFDDVPRMLGPESAHPLSALWAALLRSGDLTQRRRSLVDAYVASAMQVTREFTRSLAA